MNKIYLGKILVLALILLLILGCGSSGGQTKVNYNFKTGISELDVKFLPNAPPEKIYPYSSFKIILDLENQAGYPLNNGKIRILGLDQKYFTLDYSEQSFGKLEERSMTNPVGGQSRVEFWGKSGQLFSSSQEYVGNYVLGLSYDSTLDFVETVCLDSRLYETYEGGCKATNQMSLSGQGAPLAITRLDQIIYPEENGGEIEFRLTLQNRGKGKVGNVTLTQFELGGDKIDCSFIGNGNTPLSESEEQKHLSSLWLDESQQSGVIVCKSKMKGSSSYSTTLYVGLAYQYHLEEQHFLRIIKPGVT